MLRHLLARDFFLIKHEIAAHAYQVFMLGPVDLLVVLQL